MTEQEQLEQQEIAEEARIKDAFAVPGKNTETGIGVDPTSGYHMARWAKLFGIALIVTLMLLFLIEHFVFEGMGGMIR